MKLYCALNKLMAETKTKLLIDINKDNNINDEKILALNNGLKAVQSMVETISPHLDEHEKNKVEKEVKGLGLLLSNRLKLVMKAAFESVKRRHFKQCETRLENVKKLMDHNIQCYIHDNNDNEEKGDSDNIIDEYNKTREK